MKTINVILFGIGNVGSAIINQILQANVQVFNKQGFQINVPIIVNSSLAFYNSNSLGHNWETDFKNFSVPYKIEDVIKYVKHHELENLVAVDATASSNIVNSYLLLIENGFHIVAANKIANSLSYDFYAQLRNHIKAYNRKFYYSTNVGAGLPVLSTLRSLKQSGDEVLKVRGVFSGSLSFLFNQLSEGERPFSNILKHARNLGYTEPDPRIDLSGQDVARKLLIIARELDLKFELEDIEVQSLVPKQLNGQTSLEQFNARVLELDCTIEQFVNAKSTNEVLRYVAELNVKEQQAKVKLITVSNNSNYGLLQGTNNLFEIYSKQYGNEPVSIVGAGAGREVTAAGVLKDLVAIAQSIVNVQSYF